MTSFIRPQTTSRSAKRPQQFKLVLLGESGVGKSNLILRYVQNQFDDLLENTIGASYISRTLFVDDTVIKLDIWDTAGQERYRALTPMYYRNAHAALIVYDVTHEETFERAKEWVIEIREHVPQAVIVLAGNKIDLPSVVETQRVTEYAEREEIMFMTTSAKTGQNVNALFDALARKLPITSLQATVPGTQVNPHPPIQPPLRCCQT
eukprot:TRINITY_DN2759_c0_g1_i1.p1 TRINITY_DN2759_c0_g1~~TRINITY_DN2759_c0_g1_i1.p1  ORF type:complete len:207 (+),score=29.87 TRINITY_DN2759_c0_g1_i1:66-686(+)